MSDERFVEIETKLAHQEALLEELHQVLYKQQATIDQLSGALKALVEKNENLNDSKAIAPGNQKPPHY